MKNVCKKLLLNSKISFLRTSFALQNSLIIICLPPIGRVEVYMSVKIVIDSTVDVSPRNEKKFIIVPITVRFGNEEYLDRIELCATDFYKKLVESDVMPTTSQANIADFDKVFREETEKGNDVVVVTISSKLSGTYHSACVAAEEYAGKVFVVDSLSVTIGAGLLAEFALKLANDGLPAESIAKRVRVERENTKLVAMLDTLEYLRRGGRISPTAAFAGTLLSIKPVVSVRDGEIIILGKARGSRQSNNFLIREIEQSGGINFNMPLLLGYTGFDDVLLQKYIEDSAHLWKDMTDKLDVALVGSSIGTHAGPGAIAVAFFMNR